MANLKEIRIRIASVTSTRQITSAMKMVSAAKLKKAQDAIVNFRPYANKMQEILVNVASSLQQDDDNIYAQDRDPKQVLIVVITSNRGLCGGFNSNVVKESINLAEERYPELMAKGKVRFMTFGKKGYDNLTKRNIPIDEHNAIIFDDLTFDKVVSIAEHLMESFEIGLYDCIHVVYNEFKNAAVQKVIAGQFLPLTKDEEEIGENNSTLVKRTDYIFEPTQQYIVDELIPQNLKINLYKALLDSLASEHGARMTAMHQATDNATDLIQQLTLQYNKARQASITNEIMEIVGGAEALRG